MVMTIPSSMTVDVAETVRGLPFSTTSTMDISMLVGGLTRGSYPRLGMSIPFSRAASMMVLPSLAEHSLSSMNTVITASSVAVSVQKLNIIQ